MRCLGLHQGLTERGLDILSMELCRIEQTLGVLLLIFQTSLLVSEDLIRDQALVGKLDQTRLVVLERFDLVPVSCTLAVGHRDALLGLLTDICPNLVTHLLRQTNRPVVPLDRTLDSVRGKVWCPAAPADAAGVSICAREVLVQPTFAAVPGIEQAATTVGAVQASPQVVLVLGRSIASNRS